MSDYYPVHEETKTMTFRWLLRADHRSLQQKVIIRDGIGATAKFTEEWHTIPTEIEPS